LKWRRSRQPDWLLPKDAVAAALRDRMQEALRVAAPDLHAQVPDSVWRKGWWVHFKPAGSGENVVKYLARYVGRTAISDERILEADDQSVRFAYTDTATGEHRECTLRAKEFMRRYLQHVLPPGQHRVRYFGWLHPAAKRKRAIVETLLAAIMIVRPKPVPPPLWHLRCPHCEQFTLVWIASLAPMSPPIKTPVRSRLPSHGFSSGKSASRRFARQRLGRSHRPSSSAQIGSRDRTIRRPRCLQASNTRFSDANPRPSPFPLSPPRKIQNA
jgi:hypothetical protein